MLMEIISESYKNCELIKVIGRIDSFTSPKLADALHQVTDSGRYKFVLDMESVTYVSSAGLRVLIDIQKTCRQMNRGEIVLARLNERVYETFELAGFVPLFRFFDSITSAIGNF